MMNGALAGACVGGGVSLVQQTVEICKGEQQIKDGFIQIGTDSGKQAGKAPLLQELPTASNLSVKIV